MNSRHDSQRARNDGTQRIGHDPRRGASSPQWNREAQMQHEQFPSRHASRYGSPYGGQYGGYENDVHSGRNFSGYGDYEDELDSHRAGGSQERWGQVPNQFGPGATHQDAGGQGHHHDPDYAQWRREQMQRLDDDYEAYRRERYTRFSQDFDAWRAKRTQKKDAGSDDQGSDAGSSGSGSGNQGGGKQQG